MRERLIAANPNFFAQGSSRLQALFLSDIDRETDLIYPRTFALEADAADSGGGYELLTDRAGNMIYIECPGAVNMPDVYALEGRLPGAYAKAVHQNQELQQLVLDELSLRQGVPARLPSSAPLSLRTFLFVAYWAPPMTELACPRHRATVRAGRLVLVLRVLDMLGVQMIKMWQSKSDKEGERIAKEAGKPFADAYPTTTYKNFLINLPAAGAAAPIAKAFVPARSAKKLVLLGSSFEKELHKEADPAKLPRRLGGALDFGNWDKKKK